jgi:DNA-binding MarR family transcriptional regulator
MKKHPASLSELPAPTGTVEDGLPSALDIARARSALLVRPGFLIRRMHQVHVALFLEETQAFNITPVQYSLMTALDERGDIDQVSLASDIGLERSGIAEVIPRLEARGLITRRPSATDGRVKLHRLTPKGRALVQRMSAAVNRAHERTIEQLPPKKREAFLLMLIQLVELNQPEGVAPFRNR